VFSLCLLIAHSAFAQGQTAIAGKNIPQYIVQGSWSSPVTHKLLLEAGGTITPQDFHGYRRRLHDAVRDRLQPAGMPTTWDPQRPYGYNRSDQSNHRARRPM
jgi:hypothetical protein